MDLLQHGGSQIGVEELLVGPDSELKGRTLAEAGLTAPTLARLLAVRRHDGTLHVNPDGDLKLEKGDLLVALGTEEQLGRIAALVG
jgi:Trk K+ transport system NAD-binding subunit